MYTCVYIYIYIYNILSVCLCSLLSPPHDLRDLHRARPGRLAGVSLLPDRYPGLASGSAGLVVSRFLLFIVMCFMFDVLCLGVMICVVDCVCLSCVCCVMCHAVLCVCLCVCLLLCMCCVVYGYICSVVCVLF